MAKQDPVPSMEWEITTACNYQCSYCCQKSYVSKHGQHGSDETVQAVFALLKTLPGSWQIKLIGGEPFLHPRFFEMCDTITRLNHRVCTTTNFSLPFEKYAAFVEIAGERLAYLTASLHLEQVKSLDEFVEKAIHFQRLKPEAADFSVTSVCREEHLATLQNMAARFDREGVRFSLQHLKEEGKYSTYHNPQAAEFLNSRLLKNVETLRSGHFFGTNCLTGKLFFRVTQNGDVKRCYNIQPMFYLGNVADGTFRPFETALPCMSPRCTCTLPANNGMIRYGERAALPTLIRAYSVGWLRNFRKMLARKFAR